MNTSKIQQQTEAVMRLPAVPRLDLKKSKNLALTCDFLCPSVANAVTVSKKVATECQSSKPLKNKSFDHLCDQKSAVVLMPQAGFEPATPGLGNRCSIP